MGCAEAITLLPGIWGLQGRGVDTAFQELGQEVGEDVYWDLPSSSLPLSCLLLPPTGVLWVRGNVKGSRVLHC